MQDPTLLSVPYALLRVLLIPLYFMLPLYLVRYFIIKK